MSDATLSSLQEAERAREMAKAELDEAKRSLLEQAARQIEGSYDHVTRDVAKAHADIARGLGGEGLKTLRESLREVLGQAGSRLRGAAGEVKWPQGSLALFDETRVGEAIAGVVDPHLDEIGTRLREAGFPDRRDLRPQNGLVQIAALINPATLVDGARRVQVASEAFFRANQAFEKARKTHDDSEIDDLFD